ncbi:hypothetical protein ALP31_200224 [Pseudomonas amygdali pv. morsprunorum]|nr:hypothetical protein ALP31_200224 [Pseudomonas amygdali pv. morsprunorum]
MWPGYADDSRFIQPSPFCAKGWLTCRWKSTKNRARCRRTGDPAVHFRLKGYCDPLEDESAPGYRHSAKFKDEVWPTLGQENLKPAPICMPGNARKIASWTCSEGQIIDVRRALPTEIPQRARPKRKEPRIEPARRVA